MCASLSDRGLRTGFGTAVGAILLLAALFYPLQNSGWLPGGQISVVKLAWLACAILFWYLLPALLLFDSRMRGAVRRACIVLLVSMSVRAVVELFMMYVTGNWHPWMGISHDVFTFVLMLVVLAPAMKQGQPLYAGYLLVATGMFIPETYFAWYLYAQTAAPGEVLYFVSDSPRHNAVMYLTTGCVSVLLVYLILFSRQWLYGRTGR